MAAVILSPSVGGNGERAIPIPSRSACPPLRRRGTQAPTARLGAYYFDGWAGPLDSAHFKGLVNGRFEDRQPLSGWRDDTPKSMSAQLAWASAYGISFFVFDWYYGAERSTSPYLNDALGEYESLTDHDRVGFALLYVNTNQGEDFVVPGSSWREVVDRWVTHEFARPDYVQVNGEPLLIILDAFGMLKQFGGRSGVRRALDVVREVARAHGLRGVFIVGGVSVGPDFAWDSVAPLLVGDGYDAFTQYAYPAAAGLHDGRRPYRELVEAGTRNWDQFGQAKSPAYIPSVMVGWDPRPWNERIEGHLWWFDRTAAEVGAFVRRAIDWVRANPSMRVEPASQTPLVLLEAWNELGEGSYVVPTVGTCHRYGEAVARAVGVTDLTRSRPGRR